MAVFACAAHALAQPVRRTHEHLVLICRNSTPNSTNYDRLSKFWQMLRWICLVLVALHQFHAICWHLIAYGIISCTICLVRCEFCTHFGFVCLICPVLAVILPLADAKSRCFHSVSTDLGPFPACTSQTILFCLIFSFQGGGDLRLRRVANTCP